MAHMLSPAAVMQQQQSLLSAVTTAGDSVGLSAAIRCWAACAEHAGARLNRLLQTFQMQAANELIHIVRCPLINVVS